MPRRFVPSSGSGSHSVGEESGVVSQFGKIVLILCLAFAGMALFSFKVLPWSKPSQEAEPAAVAPVPVPAPAQVALVPAPVVVPNPVKTPPEGFVALFNGQDLTNWKERNEGHWSVKDGCLRYDGKGNKDENLVTVKTFGDFELLADWKIRPGGDSGIYLRGKPQVQIKDDPVGSGGLYNNKVHPNTPTRRADKPVGEWNTFRIIMRGENVTVFLNGERVTDNVPLENYPTYLGSIPSKGTIELQQHTGPIEFRNIFVRELSQSPNAGTTRPTPSDVELFNGHDLTGWSPVFLSYSKVRENKSWIVDPDRKVLISLGGDFNDLETKKEFKDFTLRLEWRFTPGGTRSGNGSGIVVRARGLEKGLDPRGIEIDLRPNPSKESKIGTGCFIAYGTALRNHSGFADGQKDRHLGRLREPATKPSSGWNTCEIACKGDRITVTMNGTLVNEGWDATEVAGTICLRNQNTAVEFRNIRVTVPSGDITAAEGLQAAMKTRVRLVRPYPTSEKGARTDRISVQYAVKEITQQAGLGYDIDMSRRNADAECRKWITPQIEAKSCDEALRAVLEPVGLTYRIHNGQVVLEKK